MPAMSATLGFSAASTAIALTGAFSVLSAVQILLNDGLTSVQWPHPVEESFLS